MTDIRPRNQDQHLMIPLTFLPAGISFAVAAAHRNRLRRCSASPIAASVSEFYHKCDGSNGLRYRSCPSVKG
jgi:hypothetical protein